MNRHRLLIAVCAALLASIPAIPAAFINIGYGSGHGPARNRNKRLRLE